MPATLFDTAEPRSVMTYNLKNGNNRAHWLLRRRRLARVIRNERPTLLGTQEGFRWQLDYIRKELVDYAYIGAGRSADDADELSAILYDTRVASVVDSGTWWLAPSWDTPGSIVDGENFPRVATWGRFVIDGHHRDVVMVNTHLTYQDIGLQAQVQALVDGIARIATPEDDVILTGDFNQPRQTASWQTITAAGFVDALDLAEDTVGPKFTFPGWSRWSEEKVASVQKENRIDWILYRPGTDQPLPRNVAVRTIHTHLSGTPPSDHFPVILTNQR
jgi:endonuclease/exonuclease/phosphatase family metal-dependent hydrolase